MPKSESLDVLIARKAGEFAVQVRKQAGFASKEEEIRIAVEKQLAFIQKEAGIELEGKHEFTLAKGRVDSVYSRVLIEYKNPSSAAKIGPKLDSPGTKAVVEQIKNRFRDLKNEHNQPHESLFGVGTDGLHFVFVRFRDKKWDIQEPVEVNKHSVERFLWALFNLGRKGKPFQPDYLAADFGAEENSIALPGVHALYDAIVETKNPKAQTFFNQWKILFGEVCGYDVENPSDKMKKLAASYSIPLRGFKPAELLFALHSYYALFMKLMAAEIVAFFPKLPSPLKKLRDLSENKLKSELEDLEKGSVFRHLGITNFLEGDLFAWYTSVWSEPIIDLVRKMVNKLDDYNPGTLSEDPVNSRDLLKKLYQQLFPKSVRHDLGEYYTPDWLAEHVLNEVGYEGDPDKRVLDPACGSGTFLVMTINRIKNWFEENREKLNYDEAELAKKILNNVVGFDLNPLAVMAARTNYLIALGDLAHRAGSVEIPIYLCDSIMTPSEYGGLFAGNVGGSRRFKTAATTFIVPTEIAQSREDVAKYAEQLEFGVLNGYKPDEFLDRCRDEGLTITEKSLHYELYEDLVRLDKENRNGVWARIIKNAFAPLFVGRVDYVVGNPPWVVWDNLPPEYRDSTKPLWERYGLFTLSGAAARHGGGKKDISMLMLYAASDAYLTDKGRLGFVITQTLFQTKGAGEGFRRFKIGESGANLCVTRVDDMTSFQPFEGATNWTSTIFITKGKQTKWPVPYIKWNQIGDISQSEISDWRTAFECVPHLARPIDPERGNSPWMITSKEIATDIGDLVGPSEYDAHLGANSGGANGVYWLRIVGRAKEGVLVENVSEKSKSDIDHLTVAIEPDLIYPLIRWLDVQRYTAHPSVYILLAQDVETRQGIAEKRMRREYPQTFAYLKHFEERLRNRAAYKRYQNTAPFYSMYDVDTYTLARTKVIWRRMDKQINAAVVREVKDEWLGTRPVIPQETCVLIETRNDAEAHYLCALLNSSVVNYLVKSHSVKGGKGFGTPSMLDYLRIRKFDATNSAHGLLADLSREAHVLTEAGKDAESVQRRINQQSGRLWDLTNAEVGAFEKALSA